MRCEAAVAEPEEATGEKFEYQAEVGFEFSCNLSAYVLLELMGRGFWIVSWLKFQFFLVDCLKFLPVNGHERFNL